ncbi:MAG: D-aminoacyl-tRNA deacylase [Moraxella sp.]|nr:D-aminoacyl-tRNA deacylase [Moraxella sp.]
MKVLIQRVKSAAVTVDGVCVGSIEGGLLAYVGLAKGDDLACAKKLVDKLLAYRIFENTTDPDKLGKMDKSVTDVAGGLLLVSQFTLMADTKSGRRPDFTPAMPPVEAKALFDALVDYAKSVHGQVATGRFGANMQVTAVNDGPTNFLLES